MKKARKITVPFGRAYPFGTYRLAGANILDIGVGWFRDISGQGFRCAHVQFRDKFQHFGGHSALNDERLYAEKEEKAVEMLKKEFNIVAQARASK